VEPVRDELLGDDEVRVRLGALADGWALVDGRLHRELRFADFAEAFGCMTRIALAAEKLDHHPDWCNSWNGVVVDISSHDAGGVTARCFALAEAVDRAAGAAAAGAS
jgi:4a-hydroxytetrahydrobiopterin dehydratase